MEGHDDQPTAGRQGRLGRRQPGLQLAQLVVDRDAQGLERPGRGMDRLAATSAQGLFDHGGEVEGAGERRLDPAAQDGRGDPARLPLVAILFQDMGQRAVIPGVDDVGGAVALDRDIRMSSGPSRMKEKPRSA